MDNEMLTGFLAGQADGNSGGGGMWGNGSWIFAFLIIALIFGGGGWGYGGGFGGGALSVDSAVQRGFDNQSVINKLNGLENGLASLGYDQLGQMNGINTNLAAGFAGVNNAVCTLGYQNADLIHGVQIAAMQNQNALQTQLSQCCCDNKALLADMKYQLATNTCAINTNAANNTRDLIDNANANTRAILDKLCQQEIAAKDARIAEQAQRINSLELAASQAAQNTYLVNTLRPNPVPSFNVPAPWQYSGCGCNSGCGC